MHANIAHPGTSLPGRKTCFRIMLLPSLAKIGLLIGQWLKIPTYLNTDKFSLGCKN
jgi:hypothetical protein